MTLAIVQTRLKLAGLYAGPIDGRWGPGSDDGIMTALDRANIPQALSALPKTPMVVNAPVSSAQYTIESFITHFIKEYEGGLSMDPKDAGNTYRGKLIGSKYGVTGAALATYRGVTTIMAADIAAITMAEAIQVGLQLYYDEPDFDLMPWDPVIASVMDCGWMSGPGQAIKLLQRMVKTGDDGKIGERYTVPAYQDYVVNNGLKQTAIDWCHIRFAFYETIIKVRPTNSKYRGGWQRRAASFLPDTPFWAAWSLPASNR